jgi:hypothetical protein
MIEFKFIIVWVIKEGERGLPWFMAEEVDEVLGFTQLGNGT